MRKHRMLALVLATALLPAALPTAAMADDKNGGFDSGLPHGAALDLTSVADSGTYHIENEQGDPAGTAVWDAESNTLTLDGASITTENTVPLLLPAGSTLRLEGQNSLTYRHTAAARGAGDCTALLAKGNLVIEGDGSIDAFAFGDKSQGASYGIYANGDLTIRESVSVTAEGGDSDEDSAGLFAAGDVLLSTDGKLALGGGLVGAGFVSAGVLAGGDITIKTGGEENRFTGYDAENGYGLYARTGSVTVDLTGGSASALYRVMFDGEPTETPVFDSTRAVYPYDTLALGENTRQQVIRLDGNNEMPGLLFTYGNDPGRSSGRSSGDGTNWYVIEASAGPGGGITPAGRTHVAEGKDQKFTITPDAGYRVRRLLIDSQNAPAAEEYTFKDVRRGHTVYAEFEREGAPAASLPTAAESNPKTGARG